MNETEDENNAAPAVTPATPDPAAITPATTPDDSEHDTEPDPTDPTQPPEPDPDVDLLRAKLDRRTNETISLRKRAQEAEAKLAQLQADARKWMQDSVCASPLCAHIIPAAAHDLVAELDDDQLAQVYAAARLSAEEIKKSHETKTVRVYRGPNQPDAYGREPVNTPEVMAIREKIATAKSIINTALRGRGYMLVPRSKTEELNRAVMGMNSMQTPKQPDGNALARALMRH